MSLPTMVEIALTGEVLAVLLISKMPTVCHLGCIIRVFGPLTKNTRLSLSSGQIWLELRINFVVSKIGGFCGENVYCWILWTVLE